MKKIELNENEYTDLLEWARSIRAVCEEQHSLNLGYTNGVHKEADEIVCLIEDKIEGL